MSSLVVTMSVNSSNCLYFPSSARRSSLTQTPKIDIPSDVVSRPAVIGLPGSCGSYPNSATAIKDLLMSVLNTSEGFKSPRSISSENASPVTSLQDGVMGHWEDNIDVELNEDLGSGAHCIQRVCRTPSDRPFTRNTVSWDNSPSNSSSLPRNSPVHHTHFGTADFTSQIGCKAQHDIRFTRNRASWDNAHSNSFALLRRNSPVCHRRSSVKRRTPARDCFSHGKHSALLKHSFTNADCVSSAPARVTSPGVDLERAFGSFPSPHPLQVHFKAKHNSQATTFQQLTVPPHHTSPPAPKEKGTLQWRSQSFPIIQQAVDPGLIASAESITRSNSSQGLFRPTVDLEKENEHFFVSDLIIAAFEKMKCDLLSPALENRASEQRKLSLHLLQTDVETARCGRQKTQSESAASTDSGYEGSAVLQFTPTAESILELDDEFNCPSEGESDDEYVVIETEDYEKAVTVRPCPEDTVERSSFVPGSNSAEVTAQQLYRTFRKCWLQAEAIYHAEGSLSRTEQSLVQKGSLSKEFASSVHLVEEIKLKTKLHGSTEWSPPRFQILFNIHPSRKRDDVVAAQHFRCAGCGTEVEPKYNRRLRYCDYLGKYCCDCCHSYAESCIPARILMKWDFGKYCVSNFAKELIENIWLSPAFDLLSINPNLYTKVKELDRVREHQEQLVYLKKMLKACRFAESTLEKFAEISCGLTEGPHLFTLDDLVQVKRGLLLPRLKELFKASVQHVENCELCQAKGFICEFCQRLDILFPFQTEVAKQCDDCKACFHKRCFKQDRTCPKCQRIQARKQLLRAPILSEEGLFDTTGDLNPRTGH
ncbi:protein associated with UVRAG as autophagy enhancer isoform X2 [Ambystoma mexicanum]|uniref:protein associated with UVRAG as autophagy enhancer isoform X2 n=1 Tax=Ambystoma mexicanum TaxID=8296 RepID=UPI0037E9B9EE